MTTEWPVYVVDIIGAAITATSVELDTPINYVYGQSPQIFENLTIKDSSITGKTSKYPLFALWMPFQERRGGLIYADVAIPKFIIATLTTITDDVPKRYTKTFKNILYPCYYSFLRNLAKQPYIRSKEPDDILHTKEDFPGLTTVSGTTDVVDLIQLTNLSFTIIQKKTC